MLSSVSGQRTSRIFLEGTALILLAAVLGHLLWNHSPRATGNMEATTSGFQTGERSPYLSVYDPEKAFDGVTLYPADGNSEVWLLDMFGNILHRWKVDAERARLLPNGNLIVIHGSKHGRRKKPWKDLRNTVREYNWNSEVVWEYKASDVVHHDSHRLANGNTMFLRRTVIPPSMQADIRDESRKNLRLRGDSVLEVNPRGELVYSWHAHENLDINSCGARGCDYLLGAAGAADRGKDWTHMNTVSVIPENRWFKSGDRRFRPGNFLVLPRNWWTALLIDRQSGEVVWEYSEGLYGGHEIHMIEAGLPGAGNLLLFDNGSEERENQSIIREIDPISKKTVWNYKGAGFFSRTRGSAQRLPNGNTFISEDTTGRAFEVTAKSEVVWEYEPEKFESNRARRYSKDFCGPCAELLR